MSRRTAQTWIAVAAAALAALGCGADEQERSAVLRPVTLERVRAIDVVDRIGATGQLIAKDRAEIAAEVAGRVTEIRVDEGEATEAGGVVLAIDPERRELEHARARARVDEARASLDEQDREHARVKELFERTVASQTQLDTAVTQLALARSRLDAARAELGVQERALRDAQVSAPFAGLVAERFVSRGEFVTQGQKLFELVALDPIQVEFHVNEVDSARVAIGQRVAVSVAPYPNQSFGAVVSIVSPTIDEKSRTLRVKAEIDNSDGRLRPGLFARVDLGVAERRGVAMVPEEAVLQRADGSVVFTVTEDPGGEHRAKRRLVRTGVHRDGNIEIVSGARPGDLVVTRGHDSLSDGDAVDPRTPDGDPIGDSILNVATQ